MESCDAKETKKYLYRSIIEKIGDLIRTGEFKPGDRLPPERRLAEEFGVSRTSLRQAMQALVERKIIDSRQGDGNYVASAPDLSFSYDSIIDAIVRQKGFLKDIIEFRQMMEPQIASIAAERITSDQIDRLKILVCDQHRAILDEKADDYLDTAFHMELAGFSGNRVILELMTTLRNIIDETRSGWLQSKERRLSSVSGHLRIIDALEACDPKAAYDAMRNHLLEVERHILGDV